MPKRLSGLILTCCIMAMVTGKSRAATTEEIPAPTAGDTSSQTTLDEVVVTALKRSTNLQDTPISIATVSGTALQETGATGIEDIFRQVPNVNFTPGAIGSARISIRGIQTPGEATTGLYYDETPVTGPSGTSQDPGNNAANLNLFDVDHVEVLRGPQGTLFGSGSMGGTIRVIYNKPDPTRFAGATEAQYSGVDGGGKGYFVKGMVNIPLVSDQLALRVSGYDERRPGFIDNINLDQQDINKSSSDGFHAALLYKPLDKFSATATAIYQRTVAPDQQGWYQKLGEYNTDAQAKLPFDSTLKLYNLTTNWDSPLGQVTATGSHYSYDILRSIDFTSTLGVIAQSPALCAAYYGLATACTPGQQAGFIAYGASRLPAIAYQPATLSTWTGELRITGSKGPLTWTDGFYYEDRRDHIDSNVVLGDEATGQAYLPLNITSERYVDTDELQRSYFGELSYSPIQPLTFTAGVRRFSYDKSTDGASVIPNVLAGLFPTPYSRVGTNAQGWVEKFNVSYKFTSDTMGYVTYSEGFRPGGANNIPGLPASLVVYRPDTVRNFEGGFKSTWFDRRLTVDAAGFLIKWYDLQTQATTANGLFAFLTNAGGAEIPGAELEATARPARGITLTAGGGIADAHLTQNQASLLVAQTAANGLEGDKFPNVPKYTASASASYDWPIAAALNGLVRADWAYTGTRGSAFQPSYVYYEKEPAFSTLNLRGGIENPSWGAYVFVQNVTNTNGVLGVNSTIGITNQLFTIAPRTVGVNLRANF